jgi:hypothetical protein
MNLEKIRNYLIKQLPAIIFSLIFSVGVLTLWNTFFQHVLSGVEATLFILLTSVTVISLMVKLGTDKILIVGLILSHLSLFIVWGSATPFVHFLPLIIAFLLAKQRKGAIYLAFALGLQVFELIGVLPLIVLDITVGFVNVAIILVLQIIVYTIFVVLLDLFTDFQSITLPTAPTVSQYSLANLLLNGLYASLLMHFTNNVINSQLWTKNAKALPSDRLLELFAMSNSSEQQHFSTTKITTALQSYFAQQKDFPIELNCSSVTFKENGDFQFVLITLFDLITNYYKHGEYTLLAVSMNDTAGKLHVTLTGKNASHQNSHSIAKTGRHLSKLSLFLKLTKKGSITFHNNGESCTTQLIVNY